MLKTTYTSFGPVKYDDSTVIVIRNGLLGFPEDREFILIEHGSHGQLGYLQSLATPAVAFSVMDAAVLAPEYPGRSAEELGVRAGLGEGEVAMLIVVVDNATTNVLEANLAAPIIINAATREGAQVTLDAAYYPHRFPVATTSRQELPNKIDAQANVA
jgi:flagellar assembly factor FliW